MKRFASTAARGDLPLAGGFRRRRMRLRSPSIPPPNPLTLPDDIYLGEVGGVATNSKGDIFVYTRTGHPTVSLGSSRAFAHGGSRLFQFDRTGKFVREIGKDSYGFMFAQQVRIDPQDNVWIVDQMAGYVMKLGSRRACPDAARQQAGVDNSVPAPARRRRGWRRRTRPGRRRRVPALRATCSTVRPTSHGMRPATSSSPTASATRASRNSTSKGVFIKSWGSRGTEPGMFGTVHAIAVDAQGNVYVADGGNKRIQVFDNNGTFKTQFTNVGAPAAHVHHARTESVPLHVEFESAGRLRHRRRDLQDEARRHDRRASSAGPGSG